jgi:hypothetical protein
MLSRAAKGVHQRINVTVIVANNVRQDEMVCYSYRRAFWGSTRAIRRAGIQQASNATIAKKNGTAVKVKASWEWTPYRMLVANFATAKAHGTPSAMAMNTRKRY